MNVELLMAVKAKILAEPKKFVMGGWLLDEENLTEDTGCDVAREGCGTAACIAGWAYTLGTGLTPEGAVEEAFDNMILVEHAAEELLGLTGLQRQRLFYMDSWPYDFQKRWEETRDLGERAKIAAERIDLFVGTGGGE